MRAALIAALLFSATGAQGQTVAITGGDSTLDGAAGAQANLFFPSGADAGFGFLLTPAGPRVGFSYRFKWRGYQAALGDQTLNLGQLQIIERGFAIERIVGKNDLTAFVGAVGDGFYEPFGRAFGLNTAGAGLLFTHLFSMGSFSSFNAVHGRRVDALEAAAWHNRRWNLDGTAGLLENRGFFDGRVSYSPRHWAALSIAHQDRFIPQHVEFNSAQVGVTSAHLSAWASGFESRGQTSEAAGVTSRAGALTGGVSWYKTEGQRPFLAANVSARLRSWTASSSWARGNVGFGGGYSGNYFSVGISQAVLYNLPTAAFQQTTMLTLSLRIPGTDIAANFIGSLDPLHHLRSEEYASDYVYGRESGGADQAVSLGGKFIVRGTVTDATGNAVQGAAILLDHKREAWASQDGSFQERFRNGKTVSVRIVFADFTATGRWTCATCPATAQPTKQGTDLKIILRRTP